MHIPLRVLEIKTVENHCFIEQSPTAHGEMARKNGSHLPLAHWAEKERERDIEEEREEERYFCERIFLNVSCSYGEMWKEYVI